MGAGKGQSRRVKSTKYGEEISNPKFDFGDEISAWQLDQKCCAPFRIIRIASGDLGEERRIFYYGVHISTDNPVFEADDSEHGPWGEECLASSVDRGTPNSQDKYLKNCIDKIVVFKRSSRKYEYNEGDELTDIKIGRLDGYKARICSVNEEGSFNLDFYETNETQKPWRAEYIKFSQSDFQFLDEIRKQQEEHKEFFEKLPMDLVW